MTNALKGLDPEDFHKEAELDPEQLHWRAGEEHLVSFERLDKRDQYYCSRCGTQILSRATDGQRLWLRLITVDDPADKPLPLGRADHVRYTY